jgi:hypothetical protein
MVEATEDLIIPKSCCKKGNFRVKKHGICNE